MYYCNKCNKSSIRKCYKCATKYKCEECKRTFLIERNFKKHILQCQAIDTYGLFDFEPFKLTKSAYLQFLVIYTLKNIIAYDIDGLYKNTKIDLENLMYYVYEIIGAFKFQICLCIDFGKPDGSQCESAFLCASMKTLTMNEKSLEYISESFAEIGARVDEFSHKGSGWTIDNIRYMEIRVSKYKPHSGGCKEISLPKGITNKKAIINFNCEKDCFMYCILANQFPESKDPQRISYYKKFIDKFDFTGFRGHVKVTDIPKFEKRNRISINIYSLDFKHEFIIPLQISKIISERKVNIFYHHGHYSLIKSLERLLNSSHPYKRCEKCLQGFKTIDKLARHQEYCQSKQRIELPQPSQKVCFNSKQYKALQMCPYIIYADFETLAVKLDPTENNTFEYQHHKPTSFGLVVIDWKHEIIYTKFYRGINAGELFLKELDKIKKEIYKHYEIHQKPLLISRDLERIIETSNKCWICGYEFRANEIKVCDHDHMNGRIRGAAHQSCNLSLRWDKNIPVVFHNLKNFDGHLIIQALDSKTRTVEVIPHTMEKYSAIFMNNFRFIDSFAFMASSLDTLANNLEESTKKHYLRQLFDVESCDILMKKGALPYEYIDDWSKYEETKLPPIEAFYSSLKHSSIDVDTYQRLETIWKQFNCKTLGEFQDVYLKVDVLLLTAVFESFRENCFTSFDLDPAHFVSIPGFSWTAALRMTGVELDLLTDIDMILMIEAGIRGGISCAIKHHAKANNPNVPDYDSSKPTSHISYLDVNNLYGWALSQNLPTKNFSWIESERFNETIDSILSGDTSKGYILEVDLNYPENLHDAHDDYPLAPEKIIIDDRLLSSYQQELLSQLAERGQKRIKVPKLIPNLMDKTKYVVYYKNLKYYLEKGLLITKVHKIIAFDEQDWLKPYIDMCTSKRQQAKNAFEKDLFKLMVNSLYGKSIEDKRKHQKVKIALSRKIVEKYTKNPLFDTFMILSEDKAILRLQKNFVLLDKPIHIGYTVLELAKLKMFQLHYDVFKSKYGSKLKLIYTDTDSFIYQIETKNFDSFGRYPPDRIINFMERNSKYGWIFNIKKLQGDLTVLCGYYCIVFLRFAPDYSRFFKQFKYCDSTQVLRKYI